MSRTDGKAWHITQWNKLYENSDTQKSTYMGWYKKPTKLIGLGIGKTLAEVQGERNLRLLGLWVLVETLASQSAKEFRGWLVRDGVGMDEEDMHALIPTVPAASFATALEWFSQERINWLEMSDFQVTPTLIRPTSGQPPESVRPTSGQPDSLAADGRTLSDRERERERELRENKERERGHTRGAPRGSAIPSDGELDDWADAAGVDREFARLKAGQARERQDFEKWAKAGTPWQGKLQRFWNEDGREWKNKKTPPAGGSGAGRLDAWKKGDQGFWWTDDLANVRAAMAGAAQVDKKTAGRIADILRLREGGK